MPKKKDTITNCDMFGHRFDLNFNRRGEEHKTWITGFVSIFIKGLIFLYVFIVFKRMLNSEADNNLTYVRPINLNEYGSIDYFSAGMKIFHVISKTKAEELGMGSTPSEDDLAETDPNEQEAREQVDAGNYKNLMRIDGDILDRFLDITFEKVKTDYTKGAGSGRIKTERIGMKNCTAEDLELEEVEASALFAQWENFTLICPEFDEDDEDFDIVGDSASRLTRQFVFEVNFCTHTKESGYRTNKHGRQCAPQWQRRQFLDDFQVDVWVMYDKMDYLSYNSTPTSRIQELMGTYQVQGTDNQAIEHNMFMREHQYETYDHWLYNGWISTNGSFFDIGKTLSRLYKPVESEIIFRSILWQKNEIVHHQRVCYDLMMVLGSLGGIANIMIFIFGVLLYPITEHSFITKAIRKFYMARTKDNTLFPELGEFRSAKLNEKIDKMLPADCTVEAGDKLKSRIYKHRIIYIKTWLSIQMFFAKLMGPLFCHSICMLNKHKAGKYMRLYERGEETIENELDICYIIRTLRNLNIYMKNTSMTKTVKFEIEHSKANIINLDEDSFSESSEEDESSSDQEGQKSMFEEAGIKVSTSKVGSASEGGNKYKAQARSKHAEEMLTPGGTTHVSTLNRRAVPVHLPPIDHHEGSKLAMNARGRGGRLRGRGGSYVSTTQTRTGGNGAAGFTSQHIDVTVQKSDVHQVDGGVEGGSYETNNASAYNSNMNIMNMEDLDKNIDGTFEATAQVNTQQETVLNSRKLSNSVGVEPISFKKNLKTIRTAKSSKK